MAENQSDNKGKISVESISHSVESIKWKLFINTSGEENDGINTNITFADGQTHHAINNVDNAKVEKTATGYLIETPPGTKTYEIEVITAITEENQSSYKLEATATFDEEVFEASDKVAAIEQEGEKKSEVIQEKVKTPEIGSKSIEKVDSSEEVPRSIIPMANERNYTSDDNAKVLSTGLEGSSTNDHTFPRRLWANGNTVYVAVSSTHDLDYMDLNGIRHIELDRHDAKKTITVDGEENDPTEGHESAVHKAHWTVFKFNLTDLKLTEDGQYPFFIKGQGGGHDVGGSLLVTIPTTNIEGQKEWKNGTERPEITLELYRKAGNGNKELVDTGVVNGNESPTWTYSWVDVNEYDPYGRKYTFTIDEETVPPNYTKSIDGLTVTNTYDPEIISINVNKKWIGPEADSAYFKLVINDEEIDDTLFLNEENDWSGSFGGLNKYDEVTGEEVSYSVNEVPIEGYSTERKESEKNKFTFTNTNNETIEITVKKEWVGSKKDSVTIKLQVDGKKAGKEIELNEANDWSHTFTDLRKYDSSDGKKIEYSVVEVNVPEGYEVGYSTGENGELVVTNTATKGGDVTAKYVDEEGTDLVDSVVHTGNVGDTYTTEQKDIPGYEFNRMHPDSADTSGQFTHEEQTVIYMYTK